jgi:hypothetical protein
MEVNGVKKNNGVDIANIWARGGELGRIVCKGGLIENGESSLPTAPTVLADLGNVSNDDSIVDIQVKSPVAALISVTSNSPPKYFLNVYKEPDVLRTRHLLPYTCTRVAIEPSRDFNYIYAAMFCEFKIVIKKMSVSPGNTSVFIGSF